MKLVNLDQLLPADLPPGERVLWHGRPQWISLARRAFRVDFVAGYFAALAIWNVVSAAAATGWADAALSAAKTLALGAAAVALLGLLAWAAARTTLYVVTSRRIVMKIGIALPIFYNVPFSQIGAAEVRKFDDGTGDLPVSLTKGQRIAYLTLWPHARPFHFARPQPAFRCVDNADEVAEILSRALIASANEANVGWSQGPANAPPRPMGAAGLGEPAAA